MKRLSFFLSLLLLSGCSAPAGSGSFQRIPQSEAAELMQSSEDYVILDVRTPGEYAEGHIEGAVNLPNEEIVDKEIPLLPEKDQLILVYCRSGNRSRQASQKLADLGYTNVKEFGGINTWPGNIVK